MVFSGFVTAWRLATWPTSRSPAFVNATTEGVVRPPSWLGITTGEPPSMTATTEFVVPRSIPIIFAMLRKSSCLQTYYRILVFLCQGCMSACFGCTLIVAAASDLAPLEKSLASGVPGCALRYTFGSSGMLAQQIRHGADYDLFMSANERYIDELVSAGAVEP